MNKTQRLSPVIIIFLVVVLIAVVMLWAQDKSQYVKNSKITNTNGLTQKNSQQQYHWKMVTTWPKNFPGLGTAAENLAKRLHETSNGRLQVTVHGAGEIVPALGVFNAVSSGSVEMGHSAAYYWKGKIPASPFFTSVPFGMNAQEMNGWLYYGNGLALWREVYEPFNLVPFPAGNTGVQMGGWFNRTIENLDDIRGMKMRIPGFGGEVWSRAGGTAVNIPGNELYTALQTGVIDATEWVGPYNDRAFGFHQIAKHYYYPGWQEPGPTLELIVNKEALESLPEDLQELIASVSKSINQDMLDEYTGRNNAALQTLIHEDGVQLHRFPQELLSEFERIAWAMYEEMAAENDIFNEVYNDYKNFYDAANQYHQISERAYYEARSEMMPTQQ